MKFTHDGVEYEVDDLLFAVRESAEAELLDNHPHTARALRAAAALLARCEREREALEALLVAIEVDDPVLIKIDARKARTALRATESEDPR